MIIKAHTPEEYIAQVPAERQQAISRLRKVVKENLPAGFEECMSYNMIGYVVPHSLYPPGYHTDPKQALPFINIASQKNHMALYHTGLYADPEIQQWFLDEYPKHTTAKLDMGKSCLRFKKEADIPYALIGTLTQKIDPERFIEIYETSLKNKRSKK